MNHSATGARESNNINVLLTYGKYFSLTKNLFSIAEFITFLDSYTGRTLRIRGYPTLLLFHDFSDPGEVLGGVYGDGIEGGNDHRNGKTMFQGAKLLEFFQFFQNSRRKPGKFL